MRRRAHAGETPIACALTAPRSYPAVLSDTAGLRDTDDVVEREGVRRAQTAIEACDVCMLVADATRVDGALAAL